MVNIEWLSKPTTRCGAGIVWLECKRCLLEDGLVLGGGNLKTGTMLRHNWFSTCTSAKCSTVHSAHTCPSEVGVCVFVASCDYERYYIDITSRTKSKLIAAYEYKSLSEADLL